MPAELTVISTSYNHQVFIKEHFQSLHEQSYRDFKLIYCDDCSRDGSFASAVPAVNELFPDCLIIQNPVNIGFTRTLNNALKHVTTEFVQIISCDDKLHPLKLENQLKAIKESGTRTAFAYGPIETFGSGCEHWKKDAQVRFSNGTSFPAKNLYEKLLKLNFISAPSTLIRTACVRSVGGYDESLKGEDWDMWLRLAQADFDCVWVPNSLTYYRIHQSNTASSFSRESFEEEIIRTLSKHASHPASAYHLSPLIRNSYRRGTLTPTQRKTFQSLLFSRLLRPDFEAFAIAFCIPFRIFKRFKPYLGPVDVRL